MHQTLPGRVAAGLGLLVSILVLAACALTGPPGRADAPVEASFGLPPHGLEAVIESVVDGDTVSVQIGENTETLRLLGIDTPEKSGGPRPAECHGEEATNLARELLPAGTPVLLARDSEPRDVYGRLLTYVYRAEDDLFVNLAMLEQGAAAPLSIKPNTTYDDLFARASADARRNNIGLWAACGQPDVMLDAVAVGN